MPASRAGLKAGGDDVNNFLPLNRHPFGVKLSLKGQKLVHGERMKKIINLDYK